MKLRGKVYYSWFQVHGVQVRNRLSSDLKSLTMILNDLRAKVDREDYGILSNDYSWDSLKAEFLKWARQTLRNPENVEADIVSIERYMKPTSLRQVTPEYVIGFREWRQSQPKCRGRGFKGFVEGTRITPRTVNREVGTLRQMLNKAVEWRRIADNPIAGIKPLRHDNPAKQRRALTLEEVERLFEVSPDRLKPV